MSLAADLKVLYHLTMSPVRGATHAERLESFYKGQAGAYDDFRKRLLQGREDLCQLLPFEPGRVWADFGAGTGANAEFVGSRLSGLGQVFLIDLSRSLLTVAQERIRHHGWTNVATVEADATTVELPGPPLDIATFSYSLTMIPPWFGAIDRAWELLRPGGYIGVVDFYVSRKYPEGGRTKHGWWTRTFWPTWFGSDNVFLSGDHLPYLQRKFETVHLSERRARVPYLPLGRVPYYIFVGRKPGPAERADSAPPAP